MYIANCAAIDEDLRRRCDGAEVLFFDGTLWADDEMVRDGIGIKTGKRMGHMSVSGEDGSFVFDGLPAGEYHVEVGGEKYAWQRRDRVSGATG